MVVKGGGGKGGLRGFSRVAALPTRTRQKTTPHPRLALLAVSTLNNKEDLEHRKALCSTAVSKNPSLVRMSESYNRMTSRKRYATNERGQVLSGYKTVPSKKKSKRTTDVASL